MRYAMLSDDLTGSMDAGVRMLGAGLAVGVCIDPGRLAGLGARLDLVVLDTESRNASAPDAAARVARALAALRVEGAALVYKKIDSTLRGNLGAELDAVLASGLVDAVVVAPALPYNGRVVRDGVAYVNGIRLAETEYASDPFSPLPDSRVSVLIGRQSAREPVLLGLEAVRGGSLAARLRSLREGGSGIVVADAESERDLAAIAGAVSESPRLLACGSAGLFDQMRPLLAANASAGLAAAGAGHAGGAAAPRPPALTLAARAPVVALSGSPSQVSKAQVARAAADSRITVVSLDGRLRGARERGLEVERVTALAAEALSRGSDVVVDGAGGGKAEILEAHAGDPRAMLDESERVQAALEAVLKGLLAAATPGGIVVFGGDTALNVCRSLAAAGIRLEAEAEPFVPAGVVLGGPWEGLPVVTKAGGFGSEQVVESSLALLGRR